MVKFFLLTLLRPIGRFLAQLISISTEPSAFVRERIRLGDTTNFLRAANFFLSAISSAFLAEVATRYLLGIGNLTEPYYWLFILAYLDTFRTRLLFARQARCPTIVQGCSARRFTASSQFLLKFTVPPSRGDMFVAGGSSAGHHSPEN
jgi:hypothetical protein